jgi:hypothetical protein
MTTGPTVIGSGVCRAAMYVLDDGAVGVRCTTDLAGRRDQAPRPRTVTQL